MFLCQYLCQHVDPLGDLVLKSLLEVLGGDEDRSEPELVLLGGELGLGHPVLVQLLLVVLQPRLCLPHLADVLLQQGTHDGTIEQ